MVSSTVFAARFGSVRFGAKILIKSVDANSQENKPNCFGSVKVIFFRLKLENIIDHLKTTIKKKHKLKSLKKI